MFPAHPVRKQPQLDWKNKDFTKLPYGDFSRGVNPWIWSKIRIFLFVCFLTKYVLKQCLLTIQLENKPNPTEKIRILPSRPMEIFSKGLTHEFGQKLQFSSLFAF